MTDGNINFILGSKMLPKLHHHQILSSIVVSYLDALEQGAFSGDIETSYASRLSVATDNSIYQCLPQAVVFPKSTEDLQLLCQISHQNQFHSIRFSARGGGTGTNGQSLSEHIIVDLSRHMRKIEEINIEQGWVWVEAGVVKDALNDALRPYGYFFSPDLSTSNRATIGGMINTDASGQGSLLYGKTSDHVLCLTTVLTDGSLLESKPLSLLDIDALEDDKLATKIIKNTAALCVKQRQKIEQTFLPLNRFLTGYDLKNAYRPEDQQFDISRILCGSEGTLGFIAKAKLNITKLPKNRVLVNVKYHSFDAALKHAPWLVKARALSVETMDSRVLNLARDDIIWDSVRPFFKDDGSVQMQGVNLVEFIAEQDTEMMQQIKVFTDQLELDISQEKHGIIDYQICDDPLSIQLIYDMRKKAVGLLGATKGAAKPIAFVEDTCVPPEKLAEYIGQFRALLDEHHLDYGMFGHVDAGVLHVRPALDLCSEQQVKLLKNISDEVVKLVKSYGGLMWGEHGKGFRSEYVPDFFGPELYQTLRQIKTLFDPYNQMNPSKICTPFASKESLACVNGEKRAAFDRQIPVVMRDAFEQAMSCNGNGACFNYDVHSPMCPSMKISYDRRFSPKGRAGLIREWLRLMAKQGIDLVEVENTLMQAGTYQVSDKIKKLKNHWQAKQGEYDFSREVFEAMDLCLACKACASQCPVKVDVASFRSRFLQFYYSRYLRPSKDYLVANIETMLPWMAKAPAIINSFISPTWARWLIQKTIGYVDAPLLSSPTLKERLAKNHLPYVMPFNFEFLSQLTFEQRQNYVLIVQDPFTSFYEAQLVEDLMYLLTKLGKTPILLPFKPNGKAQHIKGFLKKFAQTAQNGADFLNQFAKQQITMIGIDPALVLCYRDEYNEILGDKRGDFQVLMAHEWLLTELDSKVKWPLDETKTWYLFAHCTEKTKLPNVQKQWQQIFSHFGAVLKAVPVGCCGMAGTFGHESDKLSHSKAIFDLSWQTQLENLPLAQCMATGYSCRSQVARFKSVKLKHPVQVLLGLLA